MAKVRCAICANMNGKFCKIKKTNMKVNKPRRCEAYIYDESKVKAKQELPVAELDFYQQKEYNKKLRKELKALEQKAKDNPEGKVADGKIITPGDPKFNMPGGDQKHPLTGDLSRFMTTVEKP